MGEEAAEVTPDTGADVTIVTRRFVESLMRRGKWVVSRNFDEPELVEGVDNTDVRIHSEVQLRLSYETAHGRLTLHNVPCWVCDGELPTGLGDLLLSRPLMERLGYDPQKLLDEASRKNASYDMSLDPHEVRNGVQNRILAFSTQGREHTAAPEEAALREDEESTYFPEVDVNQDREAAAAAEWKALQDSIQSVIASGCSPKLERGPDQLLDRYRDVFRLVLGRDPPVDMPPLKVTLKPDSEPVRCKARRYPEEQRQFMRRHVEELVRSGLCYWNPHSKWCSPPLIVRNPDVDDFRMTVDVHRVNVRTLRILWPMPMPEVVLGHLREAKFFFALDFFKGYWPFLLDPSCQELFSFLTDMGVFTPTRVLMGGTDSVAYCQATVQEMFNDFLYKGLLI
ncbi:hypothetical protein PF011_g21139 [Phytophthora fragariae]|uniref:Reverse transcriptase domain-containing protein n=1 Tax=Phytophthora fragariae TaxID=53985 RepID=A0A6A3ITV1_9STRA|nr:hypothetical protein PF011_g21139 [Phytophthora fragariae]